MLVCFSFSLERIHCLRFEILFLLSRSLAKVKLNLDQGPTMPDARTVQFQFEVVHFEMFTLIWDLQIWNTDFVSNY